MLVKPGNKAGFICVRFSNGKRETDGWVAKANIQSVSTPAEWPREAWLGDWDAAGQNSAVNLAAAGSHISLTGEAVNGGGMGDHVGDLNGQGIASGQSLVVHDKDNFGCIVTFTFLGHYLDAKDAGGCGPTVGGNFSGLNVKTEQSHR